MQGRTQSFKIPLITFSHMYLAVLGSHPELSALELNRLHPDSRWQGGSTAIVKNQPSLEILGGTIKIANIVNDLPRSLQGLEQLLLENLAVIDTPTLRFGFSVYSGEADITEKVVQHYAKQLFRIGLTCKKQLRSKNRSVRIITEQASALSSVVVDKEGLLESQTDFVITVHKNHVSVARTIAVQPYKNFSDRDYGRPERDHHSGMLPIKVARMMVNIANPKKSDTILDPFCGSGTIIQEALLLGYTQVIGSDISKQAIHDTKENLQWLKLTPQNIFVSDVHQLSTKLPAHSIDSIVFEGDLGPVHPKKTEKIHRQLTTFYETALKTFPTILRSPATLVLALPAWKRYDSTLTLDLETSIKEMGYTQFHKPIFYGRSQAKVMRQIYFLRYEQV